MSDEIVTKAKRRIKRFIKTGEHQARVHQQDDVFLYKEKHNETPLRFKADSLGRLRKITAR